MKSILCAILLTCQISGYFTAESFERCCSNADDIIAAVGEYENVWDKRTNAISASLVKLNKKNDAFKPRCTCNQDTEDVNEAKKGVQDLGIQTGRINTGSKTSFDQAISKAILAGRLANECEAACIASEILKEEILIAAKRIDQCHKINSENTNATIQRASTALDKICSDNIGLEIAVISSSLQSDSLCAAIQFELCKNLALQKLCGVLNGPVQRLIASCA